MIDFNEMKRRQQEGTKLVDSLQEEERDILQHYCSLSTEAIMKIGQERGAAVNQLVINSLKAGISLGLRLEIKNGEVVGRA
jgi:hypothetical protein